MLWKRFKDGDVRCFSIVYKKYSKDCGGYYLTGNIEPGDLYIPVQDLGKPQDADGNEITVPAIREEVRRHLGFYKDNLICQSQEDLPRHYQLIGGQEALRRVLKFIEGEDNR